MNPVMITDEDGAPKRYPVRLGGVDYEGVVSVSRYMDGRDVLALFSNDADTDEPLVVMTVNIAQRPGEGCVWLKSYAENAGLQEQLVELGLIELTGRSAGTGWVTVDEGQLVGAAREAMEDL